MQRNAEWIRRGMGQYAVMNEAAITQALAELRDQVKQAQQIVILAMHIACPIFPPPSVFACPPTQKKKRE